MLGAVASFKDGILRIDKEVGIKARSRTRWPNIETRIDEIESSDVAIPDKARLELARYMHKHDLILITAIWWAGGKLLGIKFVRSMVFKG